MTRELAEISQVSLAQRTQHRSNQRGEKPWKLSSHSRVCWHAAYPCVHTKKEKDMGRGRGLPWRENGGWQKWEGGLRMELKIMKMHYTYV